MKYVIGMEEQAKHNMVSRETSLLTEFPDQMHPDLIKIYWLFWHNQER